MNESRQLPFEGILLFGAMYTLLALFHASLLWRVFRKDVQRPGVFADSLREWRVFIMFVYASGVISVTGSIVYWALFYLYVLNTDHEIARAIDDMTMHIPYSYIVFVELFVLFYPVASSVAIVTIWPQSIRYACGRGAGNP